MTASRLRVGQLLALAIGVLVVFTALGFVSAMRAIGTQRDARRAVVDRIDPALVAAQRFLIAMVDEETGVRGYALGGNDAFLEPYERGIRAAPVQLRALQRLTGRSGETQAVARAAGVWRTQYARATIAAVRSGKTTFTTPEVLAGKSRFDTLRQSVGTLVASLDHERVAARGRLTSSANRVRGIVIGSIVLIAVALLAAAAVLRRFVVRPVQRLASDVREVAGGDFDREIEAGGAQEITALGRDVDAMRARIAAELSATASMRDDLQRSNAELEQFAYVASHDLQEPLRKVASFTQMLQRRYQGQLDERADQYIDFAVDGAKRMQDLINDLLAFSRVGRMGEAMVPVDLNVKVEHALASLATRLEESGARVEVGDLPTVRGEASLLELVFANLISNGIKFRGEAPAVVSISAQRRTDDWCFTVRDNGIGIDAEYAERIFVIFQRLHPRSVYEGTGIGLTMCRKIVEYHGGTIWLDAEATNGTSFHFTLPAIEETP
jgi:signal transduction histidine kinase